jgi:hypothetical protein
MNGTELTTTATAWVRAVAARDEDTQAMILSTLHHAGDMETLAAFALNLAHITLYAAEGKDLQTLLHAVDTTVGGL